MLTCNLQLKMKSKNGMPFFDVQIIFEDETFTTSVYCKPTLSGVYTNFDSFLPSTYKLGTVYSFTFRCFQACLS